jgi:ABC-type transport system involved in cytochrome c biogenesis permease subunit
VAFGLYVFAVAGGMRLLALGGAVQAGYLAWRGITLGRIPLVGVHDTLGFLSASLVFFTLAMRTGLLESAGPEAEATEVRRGRMSARARTLARAVAVMCAAFTAMAMVQKPHSGFLPPVLNTYWFELHVALSFFSYALFGIGAVLGVIYLRHRESAVEAAEYKAVFVGYSLFSLSMIFGGVWADLAWGTYWLWTPKELWTSLLWVFYSLYLHARLTSRWAGAPTALLGVAGFVLVLFTYLGVGLLMKSSHAF